MIRILKRFIDLLDKRFPAKVYITEARLEEMQAAEHLHRKNVTALRMDFDTLSKEFAIVRKSVDGIKDVMAKNGGLTPKTESEARREAFVAGEMLRSGR
jgi:hypothetical protein